MHGSRLVFLTLASVIVLSGMIASTAFAGEWYVEGQVLARRNPPDEVLEAVRLPVGIKFKNSTVTVGCTGVESTGGLIRQFTEGGFVELNFHTCAVEGNEENNCQVRNGEVALSSIEFFLVGTGYINIYESNILKLGSFKLDDKAPNTCGIPGVYEIKGLIQGRMLTPEQEEEHHSIKFDSTTGSSFTIKGTAGELIGEIEGKLHTMHKWSAKRLNVFELSKEECKGGMFTNLCWFEESTKALLELKGEEALLMTLNAGQTPLFLFTLGTEKLEVECPSVKPIMATALQSPLTEDGTTDLILEFEGCKLLGTVATKCKVPETKASEELKGEWLKAELGHLELINKEKGEAGVIITVPFENNGIEVCPATIKGNHNITGFQLCSLLKPEEHLKAHELECHLESGLLFGGTEAQLHCVKEKVESNCLFTVEIVSLSEKWDISKED